MFLPVSPARLKYANRGLFLLGVSTGGRISELLSLTIGDVYQNRRAVTDLLYDRSIVKGGEVSRAVPVNTDGMRAIDDLIRWHRERYNTTHKRRPLFPSRNGQGKHRMTRRAAHNVLKSAFVSAGLNGHLATHSLRKSFAQRLYEQTGDVFTVQEMLGHKSIATTQKYLGVNYASRPGSVAENVSRWRTSRNWNFGQFAEKRVGCNPVSRTRVEGYDLSRLRDNENSAEIVKIG